jgi:hypothetical protein
MKYSEEHKDLFSANFNEWTPAHCISADCKMGAGIAVPMKKKFKLGGLSESVDPMLFKSGFCIYHNKVYNLITKKRFFHKPTYESLGSALTSMRIHAEQNGINKIVMPKIGSGLDGLSWPKVREIIHEVFEPTNIEILVCYI